MWAGGMIETLDMLKVGDRVRRVSTIRDVTMKQGRSGELWFVAVGHEYLTTRGPAIRERHDIVYREAARQGEVPAPPVPCGDRAAIRSWSVETSPVLLFRYSALTFNGHRIHYDHPYATQAEGYAGLVVHGPLQATLLLNLAADVLGRPPRRFDYRGLSAAVAGPPLAVCHGHDGRAWTQSEGGGMHMEARVDQQS
jgi:3-methylfumaryl-CoA hydratase